MHDVVIAGVTVPAEVQFLLVLMLIGAFLAFMLPAILGVPPGGPLTVLGHILLWGGAVLLALYLLAQWYQTLETPSGSAATSTEVAAAPPADETAEAEADPEPETTEVADPPPAGGTASGNCNTESALFNCTVTSTSTNFDGTVTVEEGNVLAITGYHDVGGTHYEDVLHVLGPGTYDLFIDDGSAQEDRASKQQLIVCDLNATDTPVTVDPASLIADCPAAA